jgi:transposase InsO family protein
VLFAVAQFRPYIYGRQFQLETDHRALCWLLKTVHSNGRLQRSAMEMQTYIYTVVHKAGISMQDADCLSRLTAIKAVCAQHATRPGDGTARVSTLEGTAGLNLSAISTDGAAQPQARQMTRREIIQQLKANLYMEEKWFEVRAMKQWAKQGSIPGRMPKVGAWARTKAREYELGKDGLLYRVSGEDATGGPRRLLVIPAEMRREVLYSCHEHLASGGHLGRDRTIQRIQERYFWPGLVADAERWCASCIQCLETKTPARQYRIRLEAVPVPGEPWDLVSVDATGPFPTTKRGNTQIVVFTDHLTRWVEAFAVPDIKTATLADLLVEHIVCRHGAPRTLLSDQGSSFISELAAAVYARLGVKKIQASAYHPQTNGLVERYNRTMKEMLAKYVDSRHSDWDSYLPYVTFAYNTSVHSGLDGLSPFQMLHGRRPTLPIDAMLLPATTQATLADGERAYYEQL